MIDDRRKGWRRSFLAMAGAALLAGCATGPDTREHARIVLPVWFTRPTGQQQADVAVDLGMKTPEHLKPFVERYDLPVWVVYGTLRGLGSYEFLVKGTYRRFSVTDEQGESSVVVDGVRFNVARGLLDKALSRIQAKAADGETELDRRNALGAHVYQRFGSTVLFSLTPRGVPGDGTPNLLMESGADGGAFETFTRATPAANLPKVGWEETATHYGVTEARPFRYGNTELSFRAAEEAAIYELSRGMVVKLSHLQRQFDASDAGEEGVQEEAVQEQMLLRMRGVRVVRRALDLADNHCLVTVQVPRKGIARK